MVCVWEPFMHQQQKKKTCQTIGEATKAIRSTTSFKPCDSE